MQHIALGIGYCENEYETVRREWMNHDVDFVFVNTVEEAVSWLSKETFVCIAVCIDRVGNGPVDFLRKHNAPPIILLPSGCSIEQRASLLQRGASDYLKNATNQWRAAQASGKDSVQFYLDSAIRASEPLTIVSDGILYFCLETHTVEVHGQTINLTPKEFGILVLLSTHPNRVYTYEMLFELVWRENYDELWYKTVANHISSLRKKLQIAPDVPNYIVSISKVGYKFVI